MSHAGRLVAILVGAALTCYCGSPEKAPQQPTDAPANAQDQTPPVAAPISTPPHTAQAQTPPAAVKSATPPVAAQPQKSAAKSQPPTPAPTVQPLTPPAQAQPPTPPPTVQPPTPPVLALPPTPPATILPLTPLAAAQAPTPPTVVILRGNPMGAVTFPHAAHAKLVAGKCDTCHHASRPERPLESRYQKCQDCHTKVATAPMKTKAQAAFHDPTAKKGICVECHLRESAAGKRVPAKCLDCHKKENAG